MEPKRILRAVLIIVVSAVPAAQPAIAVDRLVCSSGCPYQTIQGAVDAAVPNDTVIILDPVHTEGGIVIATDLTLAGNVTSPPIVQASPAPGIAADRVLEILPNADVVLQDLVIRHGLPTANGGGGILNAGELRLVRTEIVYNNANGLYGGGIRSTGSLELVDSFVFGNVADFLGGGISCEVPCTVSMLRSTIDGNVLYTFSGLSDGGAGLYLSGPGLIEASQISNNVTTEGSVEGTGGGIKVVGGQLLLVDTHVIGNQAGRAGGISSTGPLTVIRGSVSNNTATDTFQGSGGLSASGDPTVLESTVIAGNAGYSGAGVSATSPNLSIRRTAIIDNHATLRGGGLWVSSSGLTVIEESLVAGNTAAFGGGVVAGAFTEVRIRSSTISGNLAEHDGGGLLVGAVGTLELSNVTVTDNTADPTGSSGVNGGGLHVEVSGGNQGTATIRNSILADNNDFGPSRFQRAPDCAGPVTSAGQLSLGTYGLSGLDPACIVSGGADAGDDQGLLPLADNGGPTLTHALAVGSPNIDAGDSLGCVDELGSPIDGDQRGVSRVGTCDRGAFEYGAAAPLFADGFETGGVWLWSGGSG